MIFCAQLCSEAEAERKESAKKAAMRPPLKFEKNSKKPLDKGT